MPGRSLDYPPDTPVTELGAAALDELLDRGDLADWGPLAAAIRVDPGGRLADTVLDLCRAHPMFGTSVLWRTWIGRLRGAPQLDRVALSLADARRRRGLTQQQMAARMGISQSDVSKVERRMDVRLSTLRAYVAAMGGVVRLVASYPDADDDMWLRVP